MNHFHFRSLLLSGLSVALISVTAQALPLTDYFCKELPQPRPVPEVTFFNTAFKDCGGERKPHVSVCAMQALCMIVDDDLKVELMKEAKAMYPEKKLYASWDFSKSPSADEMAKVPDAFKDINGSLTVNEMGAIMRKHTTDADYHLSSLTCNSPGRKMIPVKQADGTVVSKKEPICPIPQKCSGDLFYNAHGAAYDPADYDQLLSHESSGKVDVYEYDHDYSNQNGGLLGH